MEMPPPLPEPVAPGRNIPGPDILAEHVGFVRAIARGILGRDAEGAEDVVQESLLAALRRPPRGNLRAWLGAVAKNLALMARRGDRRRQQREHKAAQPEKLPSTAEAVARLELQRLVVERVLQLPEPYRTTIIQRYLYDVEVAEIAARLGVSQDTVRTRLRRGLARLRGELGKNHAGWAAVLLLPARTAPRTWTIGALLMSTKVKIVAVSVALLLTLFVGWRALSRDDSERTQRTGAREPATLSPRETSPSVRSRPDSPPPPVDLTTVDRDLDLHGIVVDAAGAPVQGARLQAHYYPWGRVNSIAPRRKGPVAGPKTVSARDGTFALRLVRGDWVELRVRADGFADVERRVLAGERARISLGTTVAVRMIVRDGDGQPVPGARARVFMRDTDREVVQSTGADGVATFVGLRGQAPVYLDATHPLRAGPRGVQMFLPAEGTLEHAIELGDGKVFSGRVTDARTGDAVTGARVGKTLLMQPETRTDADGHYRLNGWTGPRWHHTLFVVAPGYAPGYRIAVGQASIDFALQPGVTVSGRIVGGDGAPVAAARVAAIGAGADRALVSRAYVSTDTNGRFALVDLNGALPHLLAVTARGHGRIVLDFDPAKGDLGDIALPRPLAIEGVLVDGKGRPHVRAGIAVIGENADRLERQRGAGFGPMHYGRQENRKTDDLGRFRFPDLAPGTYTLHVGGGGGPSGQHKVRLKETDVRDVRLVLVRGRSYVVTVLDDAGRPVERASVHVVHEGGQSNDMTDDRGRVELTVVGKVKSARLPYVFSGDYAPAETVVDPPAGGLRMTLARWQSISGTVVDASGKPVGRLRIQCKAGGDDLRGTATTPSGTFRVAVPPGSSVDLVVVGSSGRGGPVYHGKLDRVPAGRDDVVLRVRTVKHDRTLRVRVVAPGGGAVAGAHVIGLPSTGGRTVRALTGADGRAQLSGLPDAKVRIQVLLPASIGLMGPSGVSATPREQELVLTCRVGVRIAGQVTLPNGKPAKRARVMFEVEKQRYTAATDENGAFARTLPDAPGQVWALVLDGGGIRFHSPRQDYRPGAGSITIRLKSMD